MQSFASAGQRCFTLIALLTFALLSALPISAHADSAFISIRHYDGLDPLNLPEIERITREGFVPILSGSDGFIAYYVIHPDDGTLAAINVFESREQALASNELARDFVSESLAPLLPNPPRIVEGTVDIGFVEMLDGAGTGDMASLHASLRIYDGFQTDDLDAFVSIVEDGLLPIMRETDGFFGYYVTNDRAGTLAALSIFDTEASALASNQHAREFVADNLAAYLPNDPTIASGRVAISLLAGLNEGANLIDDMTADSVFASVRVYDGVNPADQNKIARLVDDGLLPIMRESAGFVGYYLLPAGDMLAAVSLFETADQAAASTETAREFVADNLATLLPNAPRILENKLDIRYSALVEGMADADSVSELYGALRVYGNYDMTRRTEIVDLTASGFLPIQQTMTGFIGYLNLDDGINTVVAFSIFDTEANALAANEEAAAFVAENLADHQRDEPIRINGRLGVAALAGIQMGQNLIDDKTMEDKVFASVRVYDGVDPVDQGDIARLTAAGFLPIMRESDGFVGYYLLPAGDKLAAISMFDSAHQASASNAAARAFVVENLAPMLPNPPLIVEGTVEVSTQPFADAFDESMTADDVAMPLHALLAIYDGFDMARLDETVTLVDSILLPDLRATGSLFSYHGISDGVDKAVALRIMDSEASLQLGSDIAADFIAAHMEGWLPEDPLSVSGRLAVAATAALYQGGNLAAQAITDESVFASVRVYDGVNPADQAEIARLTDTGFLPIIRESDGFVGYYFLPAEDMLATISLFDSPERATASNDAAREFIVENLAPLLPNPPTIYQGSLSIDHVAALLASDDDAGSGELYASIRFYEGFDLRHFDEANDLAIAHLLPALQELGGLFAQYAFNDGEDTVVGISVFDSEEASLAANDVGKAFTLEYVSEWAPNPPTGVSGKLAIAALAEVNTGENLVGAVTE